MHIKLLAVGGSKTVNNYYYYYFLKLMLSCRARIKIFNFGIPKSDCDFLPSWCFHKSHVSMVYHDFNWNSIFYNPSEEKIFLMELKKGIDIEIGTKSIFVIKINQRQR